MNVEDQEWVRFSSRELSVLFCSLITESFATTWPKLGYPEFAGWFDDGAYRCGKDMMVDFFRPTAEVLRSGTGIRNLIERKLGVLDDLYNIAISEEARVSRITKSLANLETDTLTRDTFGEFYGSFRPIFLMFFPLQVFPYTVELWLAYSNNLAFFEKHQKQLAEWRARVHETEIELENVLALFLRRADEDLDLDIAWWVDQEVKKYLANSTKPTAQDLAERRKIFLMRPRPNNTIPYTLLTGVKARQLCTCLEEKTREYIDSGELSGKVIRDGVAAHLPPNCTTPVLFFVG